MGARFAGEPWAGEPWESPQAGAGGDRIEIAVCGAHMAGLPLNSELLRRGARMVRSPGGAAIEVEVWSLPAARVGDFLRKVPAPLTIGTVDLEHGSKALGFLCEAYAASGAADITAYGGWRRYLAAAARTACPA